METLAIFVWALINIVLLRFAVYVYGWGVALVIIGVVLLNTAAFTLYTRSI